jgi:OmpA-OmpF porin, OOP family
MYQKTNLIGLTALLCLVSLSPLCASDNVQGMITTRTGETLIVKSAQGNVTVVLTDNTTTKDDKGLFGLDTEKMSNVVLIPGLKVKVDGTPDGNGRIVAKTITVDGDDLETSEMIQAGLHPTAQQVAANMVGIEASHRAIGANKQAVEANRQALESNKQDVSANRQRIKELEKQAGVTAASHEAKIAATMKQVEDATNRFTALADYDVKAQATVKFRVGSSSLSPEDEEALKSLAATATGLTGYIVEVTGYADSSGSAAMNTKLSEDRAKAVITFLMQQGGVPVRHIVAPGAMGEYAPAASNETAAGRAENRRVEVKVLVNKGITGG